MAKFTFPTGQASSAFGANGATGGVARNPDHRRPTMAMSRGPGHCRTAQEATTRTALVYFHSLILGTFWGLVNTENQRVDNRTSDYGSEG